MGVWGFVKSKASAASNVKRLLETYNTVGAKAVRGGGYNIYVGGPKRKKKR